MKKLILFILLLTLCAVPVLADVNAEAGGGVMGDGNSDNIWYVGDDGVRVTIVRSADRAQMMQSIDFTNSHKDNIDIHFGKKSKLAYRSSGLVENTTIPYLWKQFTSPLPQIISPSGAANIDAIKHYFSLSGTVQDVARITGFAYDKLINGDYVLLLEPIAYFTYDGKRFAATATEAALINKRTSNDLNYKMQALTHQNLPLSMFLERPALGFPAWGGAIWGIMSDNDIIAAAVFHIAQYREHCDSLKSTSLLLQSLYTLLCMVG